MFGHYQLVRLLGDGGFSNVYEAYDHKRGMMVALKLLHAQYAWTQTMQARFHRELEAGRRLRHRHIVKVYDGGVYNGRGYISMRLMSGGTVADLCQPHHPLNNDMVARILRHTARALDFAHQQGIWHRDIKPSNILLDQNGRVYLADFGITKIKGMMTVTRDEIVGSVYYMSPEQVRGLRHMDQASDIYSLGVVLYEMVTGYLPFDGRSQVSILNGIVHARPPRPTARNPAVGPHVEKVLLKALDKNPRARYPSATALANAYQSAILASSPKPYSVEPAKKRLRPSPSSQPQRSRKRRSQSRRAHEQRAFWLIMAGMVVLLLFLIATV